MVVVVSCWLSDAVRLFMDGVVWGYNSVVPFLKELFQCCHY